MNPLVAERRHRYAARFYRWTRAGIYHSSNDHCACTVAERMNRSEIELTEVERTAQHSFVANQGFVLPGGVVRVRP